VRHPGETLRQMLEVGQTTHSVCSETVRIERREGWEGGSERWRGLGAFGLGGSLSWIFVKGPPRVHNYAALLTRPVCQLGHGRFKEPVNGSYPLPTACIFVNKKRPNA